MKTLTMEGNYELIQGTRESYEDYELVPEPYWRDEFTDRLSTEVFCLLPKGR